MGSSNMNTCSHPYTHAKQKTGQRLHNAHTPTAPGTICGDRKRKLSFWLDPRRWLRPALLYPHEMETG